MKINRLAAIAVCILVTAMLTTGCQSQQADDPAKDEKETGIKLVSANPDVASLFDTKIQLDRNTIMAGEKRPAYILLTFTVPEKPEEERADRPQMNLALVLDRSGSMEDRGKMEYAKQAAKTIVDLLEPTDTLAIVEYDDVVTVLWPATPVESADMIKSQIDTLFPRGSTNLTGGLMGGVEEVKKVMHNEAINRVILMSDGLANQGITDPHEIARLVRETRDAGVSISDIGLGLDYNEDLMMQIAENGGGNYYYVENPSAMERIFRAELSTISDTVAKELLVSIEKTPAISKLEVFGYNTTEEEGTISVPMGSLYAGESRSLVVRMEIDAEELGQLDLGRLNLTFTDVETGDQISQHAELSLLVSDDEAKVAEAVNSDVQAQTTLVEVDQRHEELVRQYESGDLAGAQAGIAQLKEELADKNVAYDNLAIEKKIEALEMESEEMAEADADDESRQQYLKANKARLYQSQKGKRQGYILQLKDKGVEVENLQKALEKEGYYKGDIDGLFSKKLEDAVKAYQKAMQLTVDGVAGPGTLRKLGLY